MFFLFFIIYHDYFLAAVYYRLPRIILQIRMNAYGNRQQHPQQQKVRNDMHYILLISTMFVYNLYRLSTTAIDGAAVTTTNEKICFIKLLLLLRFSLNHYYNNNKRKQAVIVSIQNRQ